MPFKSCFEKEFCIYIEVLKLNFLWIWTSRRRVYETYMHGNFNSILAKSLSFELRVCMWPYICVLEKFSKCLIKQCMNETVEIAFWSSKLCFWKPRILQSARVRNPTLERRMRALSIFAGMSSPLERTPLHVVDPLERGSCSSSVDCDQPVLFPSLQAARAKEVTLERPLSYLHVRSSEESYARAGTLFSENLLSVPIRVLASSLHLRHS